MSATTTPPFLVVSRGASRLADAGRRDAIVAAASAAIQVRTGAAPEVRVTVTPADGRAAAREAAAAGAPLVVVAGGDGSVRTAAAVLAGTGIGLGIIPGGTGNLLAAALGIQRRPEAAVAALATARERPIDVGRASVGASEAAAGAARPGVAGSPVDPIQFMVAAGVGFDARIMAATTDRRKRRLGVGAYFAVAPTVAMRMRPFGVRLVVDGVVHETDALAILVANAGELVPGLLGPRLPLVPDDGLVDVLVARGRGLVGGSRAAVELLLGRGFHAAIGPYAARFAARHVEVETDPAEPIEVDGDVVGAGRLVVDVVPGAVRVLVPA